MERYEAKRGNVILNGLCVNNHITGEVYNIDMHTGCNNEIHSTHNSYFSGDNNVIQNSTIRCEEDAFQCKLNNSVVSANSMKNNEINNALIISLSYYDSYGEDPSKYGNIVFDDETGSWFIKEYGQDIWDSEGSSGNLHNWIINGNYAEHNDPLLSMYNNDGYPRSRQVGMIIIDESDINIQERSKKTINGFIGVKPKPNDEFQSQDLFLFVKPTTAPHTIIAETSTGKIMQYCPEDLIDRLTEELP